MKPSTRELLDLMDFLNQRLQVIMSLAGLLKDPDSDRDQTHDASVIEQEAIRAARAIRSGHCDGDHNCINKRAGKRT
jgi:hypothetical protein